MTRAFSYLAALPAFFDANPEWMVAGIIVLFGLFIYGMKDLIHFSFTRAWAISGVCFDESIRRRVLWITPLAIVGVVIVSQLQHPLDEQDAIRATTKFCLFATGLVVALTAIILACTNLPKEIENRVIYTIVTKPTTRLEIVLGKIMGFARVSATILLIMGLFTAGYVQVRAWSLGAAIDSRLKDSSTDAATLATLTHYKVAGLLNAQTYAKPEDLQILSREPLPGDRAKWMFGGEGSFIVPFRLSREDIISPADPSMTPGGAGVFIMADIGFEASQYVAQAAEQKAEPEIPDTIAAPHAATRPAATTQAAAEPPAPPTVSFEVLDENQNSLVPSSQINQGKPTELTDPTGRSFVYAAIPPSQADALLKTDIIFIAVHANTPNVEYFARIEPILLAVPPIGPGTRPIHAMPNPKSPDRPVAPIFRSTAATYGFQMRGGSTGKIPVAVYRYHNVETTPDAAGNIPFELRVSIERGASESDAPTTVQATVVNLKTNKRFPVEVSPEINRTAFFTVPAEAVAGGDFNVVLRCLSDEQFVTIQTNSLNLVAAQHSFVLNLAKSLLVLWLMSVLIVIVSIFCSTFLSWPIAIVLTVLIILGRWGVLQLGDATAPGIGNMVATDMGMRDPGKTRVVSDTVEALAKMLNLMAKVLPDITRFSALEDIERGVSMPLSSLGGSLAVIGAFGIPMIVMAYVFLRNKEVAP